MRTEATLLMGKTHPHGSSQGGQGKISLQMAEEQLSTPSPLAMVKPPAAKPFMMGRERCEKQQEVRAHFKDKPRSKVRRGKEKAAVPIASTRRKKTRGHRSPSQCDCGLVARKTHGDS